jgi:hypothetical protein
VPRKNIIYPTFMKMYYGNAQAQMCVPSVTGKP